MEIAWDPDTRLASFRQASHVTGAEARALVQTLAARIGVGEGRFGLLVDATAVATTEVGWRTEWAGFCRAHRDALVLAVFGPNAVIRLVIEAFRMATGIRIKAFAGEDQARAWLRDSGVGG